jgi:nitroimidazol reductase NimA-like FMN-containing flavoprotein (pyridoxamine 5'-phosphate oxidase superfamily)
MISRLSEVECHKVIQAGRIARLGCIVDREPYVVPINYNFEDDCVYSHSLSGLKIKALRENPRACVQVDQIESDLCWRSVLAYGRFEEIIKPNARKEALAKLLKRFPMLTPVESSIAEDGSSLQVIVFRIRIDRMTGVSEG